VDRGIAAFFALAFVGLVAGLHWTEYHLHVAGAGSFMQGRYILPLVGLAGLAVAQAVQLLPRARQGVAVAAFVGGLFALQVLGLGLLVVRFYG
jgi:hypothetical protein